MFMTKPWQWWLEWGSTAMLIAGVALTSFNIFPLNLYVALLGNLGWLAMGFVWDKWSLVIVEIVVSGLYVAGVVALFM